MSAESYCCSSIAWPRNERGADFHETSEQGREFCVAYFDDWLVTYWPDHATKELRVVELERIE